MSVEKLHLGELGDLIQSLKVDPTVALNLYVKQTLEKKWVEIVGTGLCNQTRPGFFKDGVLTIIIVHETYRMELSFISDMVLQNANKFLGSTRVYKLKYTLGTIHHRFPLPPKKNKSLQGKEKLLELVEKEKDDTARKKLIELIENM